MQLCYPDQIPEILATLSIHILMSFWNSNETIFDMLLKAQRKHGKRS